MDSFDQRVSLGVDLISRSQRIIAFTGAGISTESGLSDFRSPGGVWDRFRVVTYQEFLRSRSARIEFWTMKKEFFEELRQAKPNRAHQALVSLERMGKLRGVITQNIDGLHQMAGNTPENVIELHGTNRKANCLSCGRMWPIEEIQTILEGGNLDPHCETCGGLIKPSTISFGQPMPVAAMSRAYEWASQADLVLTIGSSLQVEPAASIPPLAYQAGARLIFINRTETPWDRLASVLFHEDAGEVLQKIVETVLNGQQPRSASPTIK